MTAPERIRVELVISDLRRAGAETQLVSLALALDRSRHDVGVVLLKEHNDFADELREAGVRVSVLRRRRWWDLHVALRLYRHFRRVAPHVVHSYLFFPNALAVLAARAAAVPAVILSQRSSYDGTLTPFWRRVARFSHRFADRVVVNSHAAWREEVAAGMPPRRLAHVPNAVRASEAPPVDRSALGLPPGPLVVALGQFTRDKGHEALLEAWSAVRERRPRASLVLVGDGPLRLRLERLARRLGMEGSVLFMGFRFPASPYLAAADLVALASLTEGMPNAVMEAMAQGKAVVATRVGGLPELVADGETGLLVPPRDPRALAAAIGALLDDPERRRVMGGAGRRRVLERFPLAGCVAVTEAVYLEVLRNARQPSAHA